MLGQIGQDQVGRDRGDLIQPGFAELALYIVFLGKTEAAVGLDTDFRGLKTGVGSEHLGHVRLGTGVFARLIQPQRLAHIKSAARMLA